jgi:co-chaperonin GroES (HSP10)
MKTVNFEGQDLPREQLPQPAGWRILVGLVKIEEKTTGGILLVEDYKKGREYLRSVGKVLAVGSEAYLHEKFGGGIPLQVREPKPWVSVGDVVMIGQYAGQTISVLDVDGNVQNLKLLNDDEVLAVIPDLGVLAL